jgi:hypothetical protein
LVNKVSFSMVKRGMVKKASLSMVVKGRSQRSKSQFQHGWVELWFIKSVRSCLEKDVVIKVNFSIAGKGHALSIKPVSA